MLTNTRIALTTAIAGLLVSSILLHNPGGGEDPRPDASRVPGLVRTQSVIDAKLARKEAKLQAPRKPAAKKPTAAVGIAEERHDMRRDESGDMPANALMRAKAQTDAMRAQARDAGLMTWEWLGPGNIGGRTRAILTHPSDPDLLLLGGVSGGIWRSTDAGDSWEPVDDFMANLNVTSLVRDAVDPDIVYAGTGEGLAGTSPGDGIFQSTDGGVTWSQLVSTTGWDFRYVNRLAVHPNDAGTVYAATGSGSLFVSDDQGTSWTELIDRPEQMTDIKVHPADDDIILLGSLGGGYRSEDGGATWRNLSTGLPGDLTFDGQRVEFAVSNGPRAYALVNDMIITPDGPEPGGGKVYKSDDYGDTWFLFNEAWDFLGDQGNYDNVIWCDPDSPDLVLVGGIDLYRSTDAFQFEVISDWREYHTGLSAHADQHAIVPASDFHPLFNPTIYFGNDGGIQKTDNIWNVSHYDGWTSLANGLGITQFYHGAASTDGTLIVGGTQDNDKLRYFSAFSTEGWEQIETGDGGDCAIGQNLSIVYGEYIHLRLKKSTNGGAGYFSISAGIGDAGDPDRSLFIAPFELSPFSDQEVIAGGINVWRTTNGGGAWSILRTARPDSAYVCKLAYSKSDSDVMWVGYSNGRLSMTDSNGNFWADVDENSPSLPDRWVTDIEIHPTNPDEVLVTFGGYTSDQVWLTTDGGQTWKDRSGSMPGAEIPVIHVNTITYHPTNTDWIFVGTDIGVFASEDIGFTWSVTPVSPSGHDGPANVEVTDLFWYEEGYLVAATYGRGMFRARPLEQVFVDVDHDGTEEGTASLPYDTVTEGAEEIGPGATLVIRDGSYAEGFLQIDKRIEIVASGGAAHIN